MQKCVVMNGLKADSKANGMAGASVEVVGWEVVAECDRHPVERTVHIPQVRRFLAHRHAKVHLPRTSTWPMASPLGPYRVLTLSPGTMTVAESKS